MRLAFEGSVACTSPPVSFQSSQVSMVPTATSAEGSMPPSVKSQASFVPEKYGSSTSPVVRAHQRRVAGGGELVAARRGAAVLPHDGPVERFARAPVPRHDGLTLVGDADGGDGLVERGQQLAAAR